MSSNESLLTRMTNFKLPWAKIGKEVRCVSGYINYTRQRLLETYDMLEDNIFVLLCHAIKRCNSWKRSKPLERANDFIFQQTLKTNIKIQHQVFQLKNRAGR